MPQKVPVQIWADARRAERDRARRLPRMPVRRSILAATIVLIAPGNSWSAGTAPWVQGIRSGGVGAGSKGLPPATPFSRRGSIGGTGPRSARGAAP